MHYDGAGNRDLPGTYSDISGDSSPNLSTWTGSTGTATFTPDTSGSDAGDVAGAASLAALALSTITDAIQEVATHRATNGAEQSRLGFASEVLTVNKANLEAANSRITDVDVADESTQLARFNVLVQAGTARLAQANPSSQTALRLLS